MAKKFECNLGEHDRRARFIIGGILVLLGGMNGSILLALLGFIPVMSAVYSHCPVYKLLDFSTAKKPEPKREENKDN